MFGLQPPRHISTLPKPVILELSKCFPVCPISDRRANIPDRQVRANSQLMHRSKNDVHELAYSITSSASNCIEAGTASPSALAVLRLMTSSNRVGCSTGKSDGRAPLRILATKVAARR